MKGCTSTLLVILLLSLPFVISARRIGKLIPNDGESSPAVELGRKKTAVGRAEFGGETTAMQKRADTLQIAGSRLPDCSHACGSCHPCRLVMVSFVCSTLEEAETCPMAYKCMCHNKSYPIP